MDEEMECLLILTQYFQASFSLCIVYHIAGGVRGVSLSDGYRDTRAGSLFGSNDKQFKFTIQKQFSDASSN